VETRAIEASTSTKQKSCPMFRYARFALLETLPPPTATATFSSTTTEDSGDNDSSASTTTGVGVEVHTDGIQVLNFCIFPDQDSGLPVWGADFVSLPNNRHLLLLDAQPMTSTTNDETLVAFQTKLQLWYQKHNVAQHYPWGGDFPDKVKSYVSDQALWTRFSSSGSSSSSVDDTHDKDDKTKEPDVKDPVTRIQGPAFIAAVEEHLDIYIQLLQRSSAVPDSDDDDDSLAQLSSSSSSSEQPTSSSDESTNSRQASYIQYRRENDPARPMLKALFGEEWTERVLHEVLFPPLK
jgi:hypothetical protein